MFSSIFILGFSVGALIYWARHATLEIMRGGSSQEEASQVAEANKLEFQRIRLQLDGKETSGFENMYEVLLHDFLALTYLLRYAATFNVGSYTAHERLLVANFHLLRLVYRLAGNLTPRAAHSSLLEMTETLEYFATVLHRRMVAFAATAVQG